LELNATIEEIGHRHAMVGASCHAYDGEIICSSQQWLWRIQRTYQSHASVSFTDKKATH